MVSFLIPSYSFMFYHILTSTLWSDFTNKTNKSTYSYLENLLKCWCQFLFIVASKNFRFFENNNCYFVTIILCVIIRFFCQGVDWNCNPLVYSVVLAQAGFHYPTAVVLPLSTDWDKDYGLAWVFSPQFVLTFLLCFNYVKTCIEFHCILGVHIRLVKVNYEWI